ncbi:Rz1 family lipoprotein [Halopseudomonas pachastrellae]|nr:Rz1 family lipoprotein [Halopseudomonas pachastrellae]
MRPDRLVLLGFGVGWSWQGANGEAALERANTAHANTLGEIARAGQRQLQKQQELLVAERERMQALDQDTMGSWKMRETKTNACRAFTLMLTLSVAACASKSELPRTISECSKPQAAAAWAMSPPSNSVQKLDQLFGISEPE